MTGRRHVKAFAHWVALVTLVFATLAPTLSHALSWARDDVAPWGAEVCSVNAPTEGDTLAGGSSGPSSHVLDHCPYCGGVQPALAVPPTLPASLPVAPRADTAPAAPDRAAPTSAECVPAQPRGPPALA